MKQLFHKGSPAMNYRLPLAILIWPLLIPSLLAQDDNAAIERELQERVSDWQSHFNAHDAAKVAEQYAVDCDVLHDGQPRSSRSEMEVEYRKHFTDNPNVTTKLHNVKHRVLSGSLAIESGTWTESNHSAAGMATAGSYTCVYEKRDGTWVIVHERAWPIKDLPLTAKPTGELPTIGNYLWGDWHVSGSISGSEVRGSMSVRPTADGKAQFYEWEMERDGATKHGSAIGGIDPVTGSVMETAHAADGDHWVTRWEGEPLKGLSTAKGVRSGRLDGRPFLGAVTVERTSENRFTYRVGDNDQAVIDIVFERIEPSENLWSFLEGIWEFTGSDGATSSFRLERDKSGLAFVGSGNRFCGIFGMNASNREYPMLAMGIHEGEEYSTGNWKRNDDGSVAGNFTMFRPAGETEHSGLFEPIEDGYRYTIDGKNVNYLRRK